MLRLDLKNWNKQKPNGEEIDNAEIPDHFMERRSTSAVTINIVLHVMRESYSNSLPDRAPGSSLYYSNLCYRFLSFSSFALRFTWRMMQLATWPASQLPTAVIQLLLNFYPSR